MSSERQRSDDESPSTSSGSSDADQRDPPVPEPEEQEERKQPTPPLNRRKQPHCPSLLMIKYGSCCMTVFQSLIPLQNPDLPYLLGTSSFPGHAKRTDTANVEHCRRFMSVVSVGSPSRFQQQRQPMCCGAAPWHRTIALGFSKCWWTSQRTLPRS